MYLQDFRSALFRLINDYYLFKKKGGKITLHVDNRCDKENEKKNCNFVKFANPFSCIFSTLYRKNNIILL